MADPIKHEGHLVRFVGEGHAYNPVFSLDGKYVAFEVNRYAGNIELFFSEVNGALAKDGKKVTLPGGSSTFKSEQVVINPTWHPDGIAVFEGSNEGGKYRLYFAQPGGASAAEMLDKSKAPGDLTFPTVSPDGNLLGFVSDQTGAGDIRTWHRSTGAVKQITSSTGSEMYPLFSRDGNHMLFTRKVNNSEDVFELDLGTGNARPVVGGRGDQTRPAYAGDDRIVYFTTGASEEDWDIVSAGVDGSDKKVLAKGVRLPLRARPALTPDKQWVGFAYDNPELADSVWITRIDGSKKIEIATDYKGCGEPAFGTQNGRLIMGFTALPQSGSDWRFLALIDVTDSL